MNIDEAIRLAEKCAWEYAPTCFEEAIEIVCKEARAMQVVRAMPPGMHLRSWEPQPNEDNWCVVFYETEEVAQPPKWTADTPEEAITKAMEAGEND